MLIFYAQSMVGISNSNNNNNNVQQQQQEQQPHSSSSTSRSHQHHATQQQQQPIAGIDVDELLGTTSASELGIENLKSKKI